MSRFSPSPDNPQQMNWRKLFFACLGILLGLFLLFFIIFALTLPRLNNVPPLVPPRADGIVVFTGTAPERIAVGLGLLGKGQGKRLLISGVYDDQDFASILAMASPQNARLKCCIDLDYEATNTLENTQQTAIWAQVHDYRSVIIVTSAHHMPRAFLEMRRTKPNLSLSAYPVVPENVRLDKWWLYPGTLRLLMGEYIRYLWALANLPHRG